MLFNDLSESGVDQDIATVLTFITGYCAQFRPKFPGYDKVQLID